MLDLSCDIAHHALHFARMGFDTHAFDAAERVRMTPREEAMFTYAPIAEHHEKITAVSYGGGDFDYVLAFNVIDHRTGEIVRWTTSKFARVLRGGVTYWRTMLTKTPEYGLDREVVPNTRVEEINGSNKAQHHF